MSQGAAADPNLAARQRPDAPLGTLIFRAGLVPADALEEALEEGIKRGRRLGEILIERGLINETDLARILAGQKGLTYVDPTERNPDPEALALLSEEKAKLYRALPLGFEDGAPLIAITDPTNDTVINEVTEAIGREPRFAVAARSELVEAIVRSYGSGAGAAAESGGLRLAEPPSAAPPHEPVPTSEEVSEPEAIAVTEPDPEPEPAIVFEPDPAPAFEPEPAVVPEPVPFASDGSEPATNEEPLFAPHLIRTEPTERRPAFATHEQVTPERLPAPVSPAGEETATSPMFSLRSAPAATEPVPEHEAAASVEEPIALTQATETEPEQPAVTDEVDPEPEEERAFDPGEASVSAAFDLTVANRPEEQPQASLVEHFQPTTPEVATDPVTDQPPERVAAGPNWSAPTHEAASATPPPAPVALTRRVVLRLADGDHVELARSADDDAALSLARTFVRELGERDVGDWPLVAGRLVRPDAIVSIDVEIDSEIPI